ncbi:hypothetical protein B0H14DRAFT_2560283 [Mycena olivaceomarginata]|nr:hypothetical protein B0H14DRAFT_2560283 [Mycena olivaceomarginata]
MKRSWRYVYNVQEAVSCQFPAATITTLATTLVIITVLPLALALALVITRAAAGLLGAWVEHFASGVEEGTNCLGGRTEPAGDARQEAQIGRMVDREADVAVEGAGVDAALPVEGGCR